MIRMLKEIKESPQALYNLIRLETGRIERFARFLSQSDISLVTFVARGTSDNAALYGKYLIESLLGIPSHLAAPSIVTIYKSTIRAGQTLTIGISQSGEGTDVNEYLAKARESGSMTLAITNSRGSSITKVVDEVIHLHARREEAVAATKTYVTQCMALLMLAANWSKHNTSMKAIPFIPEAAEQVLKIEPTIKQSVERYRFAGNAVVLGRGYHYSSAKEMALKLMETCYLPTQPFSIADFMHGPIAMIHKDFPMFLFITRGRMNAPMMEIAKNIYGKGAESIIFSNTTETKKYATQHFMMPRSLPEIATPVTYIIAGQLFAYYLSISRGLDPDKPKYLQKITKTL